MRKSNIVILIYYVINTFCHSEKDKLINELTNVKELYLAVCREKDILEDQLSKLKSGTSYIQPLFLSFIIANFFLSHQELNQIGTQNYELKKELENVHKSMEENLKKCRASLEESFNSKLHTAVQEQLALMRPKSPQGKNRDTSDLIPIEINHKG